MEGGGEGDDAVSRKREELGGLCRQCTEARVAGVFLFHIARVLSMFGAMPVEILWLRLVDDARRFGVVLFLFVVL